MSDIIEYPTVLYKDLNCVPPGVWNLVQCLFLACHSISNNQSYRLCAYIPGLSIAGP